jgi:hypothetical protein
VPVADPDTPSMPRSNEHARGTYPLRPELQAKLGVHGLWLLARLMVVATNSGSAGVVAVLLCCTPGVVAAASTEPRDFTRPSA